MGPGRIGSPPLSHVSGAFYPASATTNPGPDKDDVNLKRPSIRKTIKSPNQSKPRTSEFDVFAPIRDQDKNDLILRSQIISVPDPHPYTSPSSHSTFSTATSTPLCSA